MKHLEYKGYRASITFEADSDVFVGRLAGITDIITFEADTVDGLKSAFIEAVDDYLQHCEAIGKKPQKNYSGKVMLRINPELHRKLAEMAELNHTSINELAEKTLQRSAFAL